MSKIGVHSVLGPKTGFGNFLRKIRDAGQTLAVVKCVDDFGPAQEAKQVNPTTLTVGRLNTLRDAEGQNIDAQGFEPLKPDGTYVDARKVAEWYYSLARPKWQAHPFIDVWETFNELSSYWDWQSDFYIAMMDLADVDGFKLAHYACSTGNPPNAAAARQMLPCLKEAKKRGHYLALHEYGGVGLNILTLRGTQPLHALRHRALYQTILIPNQADPKLIISECGQDGGAVFAGTETFIEDFAWYDSEVMKDEHVVGVCAWTLGNWAGANFQEALPALADYIISHPTLMSPLAVEPVVPSPIFTPEPTPPVEPPIVVQPPVQPPIEPPIVVQPPAPPPVVLQPPVEPPTPPPVTTARPRGAPRWPYLRTYLLLPNEPSTPQGNARLDAWINAVVASGVLSRYRWTMGTSADDAGIGDLDRRNVIAINPATWPDALDAFFAREYPGVRYDSVQAAAPEELTSLLANIAFG